MTKITEIPTTVLEYDYLTVEKKSGDRSLEEELTGQGWELIWSDRTPAGSFIVFRKEK